QIGPVSSNGDEAEEIRRVHERLTAAINVGDLETAMSTYADDMIYMLPNEPQAAGKEAVRTWVGNMLNQFLCELAVSVAEVEVAGDWAFDRGTYTLKLTPKSSGSASNEAGNYLFLFHRQVDRSWKLARVIRNS